VLAALPAADRIVLLEALGHESVAGELHTSPPRVPTTPKPLEAAAEPPATATRVLDVLEPVERLTDAPSWTAPEPASTPAPHGSGAPIRHRPLLAPGRDHRVLRAAFARPFASGTLDVRRATERVARGRLPLPLPWKRHWSAPAGSHLLLDIGAGMQPFAADQADVTLAAQRVLGRGALHVERFRQVPTRPAGTGSGAIWTWRPYRLPAPRTSIVIVTDLGLGGPLPDTAPASPSEWIELFAALAAREIVPVILLPYRPTRLPAELRRRAAVIHWDRHTEPRRARWEVRSRITFS
jgi:hypothetical protein